MTDTFLSYLHAFNHIDCLSPRKKFLLAKRYKNTITDLWKNLLTDQSLTPHERKKITPFITRLNPDAEWTKLIEDRNIRLAIHPDIIESVTNIYSDRLVTYPSLLANIGDPPLILYIKGKLPQEKHKTMAIVGSRRVSSYGKQVTKDLILPLRPYNESLYILSGLAYGVDTLAHESALDAGIPTGAVLGSGFNFISEFTNKKIVHKIIEANGAIISEFPPSCPAKLHYFPQRNRVISGLSHAVLIIEAAVKSGSLITARHALEQNRDVLAVPGSIYNIRSAGTNALIKKGAVPITSPEDIIAHYNLQTSKKHDTKDTIAFIDPQHEKIYNSLSKNPTPLNFLIGSSEIKATELFTIITELELQGCITLIPGAGYVKTK